MRRAQNADLGAGEDGFSFVETVLVLVLIGAILAFALPSYRSYSDNQRALIAARTLASDLRVAQQEAVTRRADIDVTFTSANAACGNGPAYEIGTGAVLIKRSCISPTVAWVSLPPTVRWEPTGITTAGATLSLRAVATGKTYTVQVAPQTGAITDDTRP